MIIKGDDGTDVKMDNLMNGYNKRTRYIVHTPYHRSKDKHKRIDMDSMSLLLQCHYYFSVIITSVSLLL